MAVQNKLIPEAFCKDEPQVAKTVAGLISLLRMLPNALDIGRGGIGVRVSVLSNSDASPNEPYLQLESISLLD